MTILLISDIFPPKTGGSGRWFWEIYRRLPREEFLIAAGEDARQEEFDRGHDLRMRRMPLALPSWGVLNWRGLTGYWRAVRRLRKLVAAEGVGMVHCGRVLPEGLMGLALKCRAGIPFACYVHGEEMQYASASRELSWLVRRVLRGAAFVIANSRNTQRILEEAWRLPAERIHLLHPGVDTQRFVPAPRNAKVHRDLGWGERPVVLTVGRLQKRKGHDQMIGALARVRRRFPEVLYAIVGAGEELANLKALAARLGLEGSVQFLGELDDQAMVRCYQQCDLFVLPNRQVGQDIEGFGMVLLEAQACGTPVIAGASGGTAETMRIPQTGRVVNCDGPDELAELVMQMLADPALRAQMGQAGRQWVEDRFDWESLSRQAEQLFQGRDLSDDHAVLGRPRLPKSSETSEVLAGRVNHS